ncbi:HIRAN domain-containing protein [Longibaculum muris]|uniref:HIRAN domain-containing protein n=1 Tax=Longibaculum muris TaxID=1796628 RepID=UPI0012B9B6D5|nr:HIRAN domain-containing protein [Longibaculum muris]
MNKEMWLIWKQPTTRRRYKIGSLIYDSDGYVFKYIEPELNDAKLAGFRYFPGFEDTSKEYKSKDLFANIDTRLPNNARADYLEILNSYNLEFDSSKLEILKATKGRLITDNYEFVVAFDTNKVEFDVAGTRHCPDVKECKQFININDKLSLELESDNKYDENAIKVIFHKNNKKYHLGYVPRYYAKELTELLKNKVEYSAMIQSINFESELTDEDITAYVKLIFK